MAISKAKKEEVLEKLTTRVGAAAALVFVNFHKLSVADTTLVRRGLEERGVSYMVAKKTLLDRALATLGVAGDRPALEGEVAVAWSDDALAPAKGLAEFVKKFRDHLTILGGIFEKRYIPAAEVQALAAVPSREVLLAQLANVLNAPIQRLVSTLSGIPRSLVIALHEISKKK